MLNFHTTDSSQIPQYSYINDFSELFCKSQPPTKFNKFKKENSSSQKQSNQDIERYLENIHPNIAYESGSNYACNKLKEIQSNLKQNSSFLDFGAGEGYSFFRMRKDIDKTKFSNITLYEPNQTNLFFIKNYGLDNLVTVHTETPKTKFDFISMWFVAGLDKSSINEATNLLNDNGYIMIFDYNIKKGLSKEEVLNICSTELEKKLIKNKGFNAFYERITPNLNDYRETLNLNELNIYSEQKISNKFCVIIGKK